MFRHFASKFRRAFTLVELIVVIVIVGILAAISIVGYQSVVDRVDQAAAETTLQSVDREYRALAAFNAAADSSAGVPIADMTVMDGIDYSAGDTDSDGLLEPGETISFDGVVLTLSAVTTSGSISGDAGTGVGPVVEPPSEVLNVTLVASGFAEFSFSFDAPADDGGSAVTGFEWRAAVDGGAFTDWEPTAGLSDVVSVPNGVADATFEIRAVNAAGASDPVSVSTQIPQFSPNAPPQVSITPTGPGMFDVSWDAATVPNDGPAVSYEWRISLDGGTWSDWEAHSSLSATLSTDVAYNTVDFEVRAVNAAGVSAATAVSEIIPPPAPAEVELLLVAGGGGGGQAAWWGGGGGGGAGGMLTIPNVGISTGVSYTVSVGAGGTGGSGWGAKGSDSVFASYTAIGGGLGAQGGGQPWAPATGGTGGSGGGSSSGGGYAAGTAGQGSRGGYGDNGGNYTGGGGGGAGGVGRNAPNTSVGGAGGPGKSSSITGSPVTYARGGNGGDGWGGAAGANGAANTGNGGGGGAATLNGWLAGGNGGSGVVIIRFDGTKGIPTISAGLTYTTSSVGGDHVIRFTSGSGTITW